MGNNIECCNKRFDDEEEDIKTRGKRKNSIVKHERISYHKRKTFENLFKDGGKQVVSNRRSGLSHIFQQKKSEAVTKNKSDKNNQKFSQKFKGNFLESKQEFRKTRRFQSIQEKFKKRSSIGNILDGLRIEEEKREVSQEK
mmetsp:Transcript_5934/g.5094  ORF Transcript_5934/g.5094 Transcript_5934/m.5094 type:complete len:141 (+) Transcript_5934:28-450(+)